MADRSLHIREAQALLTILQQQAQEATALAGLAGQEPAHPWNHPYRQFRDKLIDFEALASLLKQRLEEAGDWAMQGSSRAEEMAKARELHEQFIRLDALMLTLFVRTTGQFAALLAREPTIPLGSAEKLAQDRSALRVALARLDDPELRTFADPALRDEIGRADLALNGVIEAAPKLPDFGPSGRRGGPDRRRLS